MLKEEDIALIEDPEIRQKTFNSNFTKKGNAIFEVENELYCDNPIPPFKILQRKPCIEYKLKDSFINDFEVRFYEAFEYEPFYTTLKEVVILGKKDVLWYTKVVKKTKEGGDRPMLVEFLQENNRYVFIDKKNNKQFSALLVDSSASLETGEKNQRSTGFIVLRDIRFFLSNF